MYRLINLLVAISLVLSSVAPASVAAATSLTPGTTPALTPRALADTVSPSSATVGIMPQAANGALPAAYLPFMEPADAQPLMRVIPRDLPGIYGIEAGQQQDAGPYRTTVRVRGVADLARLKALGVTVLSATADSATIIIDRSQLEQVAKLNFYPRSTELTALLVSGSGSKLPQSATSIDVLAATAVDSDNDGLNDTEEGWWCTLSNNADSDNDKVSDGAEVQALADWLQHKTLTRPASAMPFSGWPPDHANDKAGCYDRDYDSVPDAVEVYVFGLNPIRESTARDRFDDGQKLFGITNCPGSGGGCGYGALPRLVDWGVIFSEMPSWVKAPYDSPFVAAFPEPNVEVVPSSFIVTAKTLIQSSTTIGVGDSKTFGTAVSKGTSKSEAYTKTWNKWEESSDTRIVTGLRPTTGSGAADTIDCKQFQLSYPVVIPDVGPIDVRPEFACQIFKKVVVPGIEHFCLGEGSCIGGFRRDVNTTQKIINSAQNTVNSVAKKVSSAFQVVKSATGNVISQSADFLRANTRLTKCNVGLPANLNCDIEIFGQLADETKAFQQQQAYNAALTDLLAGSSRHQLLTTNGSDVTGAATSFSLDYPVIQFPTHTETQGHSWGGAHTTTFAEFEEHTQSQSQQFMNSTAWATAYTTDTVHIADMVFTYRVSNSGSDYAREINNISFNIYIGDNPNPICTYFAGSDECGKAAGGTAFANFTPGEAHIYTSHPIPLTLDQMKRIDLGEHIFVVVEDFSFGVDELFYQDALNSGVTFFVDDGVDDNNQTIDAFILPTWDT